VKPNYLKFCLYLAIVFVLAGCGGGSNRTNPITVAITGAPSTVTVNTMATLGVMVTNDAANAGVTWGVTGGGTFTSTTTSLVYTAPPTVPSSATVTVTATSITDTTKSNSVTFTIVAAPAVSVTINNPISTIAPGAAAVTVNATVTNDGTTNPGVTWTLVGTGTSTSCQPTCGTLSGATTTSVIYTPPATVPSPATASLVATSNTDGTKSAIDNITIAAGALSVHITNPLSTVPAGSAAVTINATVTNDGSTPGVTWTLVTLNTNNDCQPGCGTLSGATTTSVVYTPPSNVPAQPKATIFAKSNSDSTKYGENTFTITGTTNTATCTTPGNLGQEAALTQPYAFLLKGQDAGGGDQPLDYVGSFTPNGSGGITQADLDLNGFSVGSVQTSIDLSKSSYSYGSDGRGCLFLAFTEVTPTVKPVKASAFRAHAEHSRKLTAQHKPRPAVSEEVTVIFAFAIEAGSETGRIQEFDNLEGDGFFAAGQMHQQLPGAWALAGLSPNFAFGIDGWVADIDGGIDRSAIAGSFANSNTGGITSLTSDTNFAGALSGEQTGGSGNLVTAPSTTTGRGQGQLTVNTVVDNEPAQVEFDFVYYVVNDADIFVMSSDDTGQGSQVLFAGRALSTGTTSGAPSGNFLSAQTGLDCSSCPGGSEGNNFALIGTLNVTAAGAASGINYANDAGTFTTSAFTGTFALEQATQRGQVTGGTSVDPPVAYFTNTGAEDDIVAFLVGTDNFGSGGFVLLQTKSTPAYNAASITGNYAYGTAEDISGLNGSATGVWNFDGVSAYTNILDLVQPGGTSTTPFMFSGTYSVNGDGSGTYSQPAGTTNALVTNGTVILGIEESSDQPQLHVFIQQPEK
jgi:hypothetical protein